MIYVVIAVFAVCNLIGYASMGIDKYKAKKHLWRIPEATLFLIALFGGVGSTLGMYKFHHKTKHWYFKLFFPILAVLNVALLLGACYLLLA